MITLKKQLKQFPDLFLQERSATKRLSVLLTPTYHRSSLSEIISEAIKILTLEDTVVSDNKKKEYIQNFKNQKNKLQMQYYLTNIVMKGSNLTV